MKKVWFFLTFLLFVCIIEWEKNFTFLYIKMKNKRMLVKWCLVGLILFFFWFTFSTEALTLTLTVESINALTDSILKRNIHPIHFADNWNDFGGFIYFSNGTWYDNNQGSEEIFNVKLAWVGSGLECQKQMKWFYYNAERGERLWPIDSGTRSTVPTITWYLKTEYWIYTLCRPQWYSQALEACMLTGSLEDQSLCVGKADEQYAQDNGYYGMVKHTLTGSLWWEIFYLLAGVDYQVPTQSDVWVSMETSHPKLVPNFIRYNNKLPVWLVYDDNGWVWFVGCMIDQTPLKKTSLRQFVKNVKDKLSSGSWLEDLFEPDSADESILLYRGPNWNPMNPDIVRIDCSEIWTAENSLVKLIIEWLVWMNRESDLWVIGNQTNSKMQYFSSSDINNATLLNYAKQRSEVLCRWKWNDSVDGDVICLKWVDVGADSYIGKTLIVKNWNVVVSPATGASDTWHYDIFINGWNLIINETNDKFVFDRNWFVASGVTVSDFNTEVSTPYLSGFDYTWNLVAVGSFIRGNFVVNWKVEAANTEDPVLHNKYFIYGKFTTKDSFSELENKFQWRCNNWYTTDGSYCPPSVRWWKNSYENASLVVIDQNYDSLLFWG